MTEANADYRTAEDGPLTPTWPDDLAPKAKRRRTPVSANDGSRTPDAP